MRRICNGCGAPLAGKKGHGFVKGGRLICGREKIVKTLVDDRGNKYLDEIKTPECRW